MEIPEAELVIRDGAIPKGHKFSVQLLWIPLTHQSMRKEIRFRSDLKLGLCKSPGRCNVEGTPMGLRQTNYPRSLKRHASNPFLTL